MRTSLNWAFASAIGIFGVISLTAGCKARNSGSGQKSVGVELGGGDETTFFMVLNAIDDNVYRYVCPRSLKNAGNSSPDLSKECRLHPTPNSSFDPAERQENPIKWERLVKVIPEKDKTFADTYLKNLQNPKLFSVPGDSNDLFGLMIMFSSQFGPVFKLIKDQDSSKKTPIVLGGAPTTSGTISSTVLPSTQGSHSSTESSRRSAVQGTTLKGKADCEFANAFPWKSSYQRNGRFCPVSVTFDSRSDRFEYIVEGDMLFRGTYLEAGSSVYLTFNNAECVGARLFKVNGFGDIIDVTGTLALVGGYTNP